MAAVLVTDGQLQTLSTQVGNALMAQGLMLACAESCTGGWVAKSLTDIAGSSHWFERGFVTYNNVAKQEMLGVDASLLDSDGAVSENVVCAMAKGCLGHSRADVVLGISGIAGPGGGTEDKPVGLVWLAWGRTTQTGDIKLVSQREVFPGDRNAVRRQSVACALQGVLTILNE